MRTSSTLVISPYLMSLEPWPELACLAEDPTAEVLSEACETSGTAKLLQKDIHKTPFVMG